MLNSGFTTQCVSLSRDEKSGPYQLKLWLGLKDWCRGLSSRTKVRRGFGLSPRHHCCARWTLLASLILASKFMQDKCYLNSLYLFTRFLCNHWWCSTALHTLPDNALSLLSLPTSPSSLTSTTPSSMQDSQILTPESDYSLTLTLNVSPAARAHGSNDLCRPRLWSWQLRKQLFLLSLM